MVSFPSTTLPIHLPQKPTQAFFCPYISMTRTLHTFHVQTDHGLVNGWDAVSWDIQYFIHFSLATARSSLFWGLSTYSRMVLSLWEGLDWIEHPVCEGSNCMDRHPRTVWIPRTPKLFQGSGRICHLAFSSQAYSSIFVQSFRVFTATSYVWPHWTFTNAFEGLGTSRFRYEFPKFTHPEIGKNKKLGLYTAAPLLFSTIS